MDDPDTPMLVAS
jgi:hypothetical protein